ncbi:hypothetical protein JOB18_009635 [Solea senegalensis]|uniref:Uncharacterized protein n=1 Tax=Solea senegalensis TaxID=28829 RepID=A0AAV6RDB0_SOLSE|nr:hypothetical protein JOB18_009635 [Solea senegalensis]
MLMRGMLLKAQMLLYHWGLGYYTYMIYDEMRWIRNTIFVLLFLWNNTLICCISEVNKSQWGRPAEPHIPTLPSFDPSPHTASNTLS